MRQRWLRWLGYRPVGVDRRTINTVEWKNLPVTYVLYRKGRSTKVVRLTGWWSLRDVQGGL